MTNGLPTKEIIAQSNVKNPIPRPDWYPNNWLTTMLFGAIQHTQLKMLSAVKIRLPGRTSTWRAVSSQYGRGVREAAGLAKTRLRTPMIAFRSPGVRVSLPLVAAHQHVSHQS